MQSNFLWILGITIQSSLPQHLSYMINPSDLLLSVDIVSSLWNVWTKIPGCFIYQTVLHIPDDCNPQKSLRCSQVSRSYRWQVHFHQRRAWAKVIWALWRLPHHVWHLSVNVSFLRTELLDKFKVVFKYFHLLF